MYRRPTTRTRRYARGNTRYTLRFDLQNRRVTSTVRVGKRVRKIVKTFDTRDEARDYVERVDERRHQLGYVPTSVS